MNEADDLNLRTSPFSHQVYQWENINSVNTNGLHNADTTDAVHANLSKETEPEDAVWTDPTFADGQTEEEHTAEDVATGNQLDQTQESLNTQSPTTALNPENLTAIQNSNLQSEQTKTSQSTQMSQIDIMYVFVKEQILAEKRKKVQLQTESVSAISVENDVLTRPKSTCLLTELVKSANIGEVQETENASWKVKERLVKTTIEKKSNP